VEWSSVCVALIIDSVHAECSIIERPCWITEKYAQNCSIDIDTVILCIVCLLDRKMKEQVSCSLDSAKTARQEMQLYKTRIVHSVKEEYKEMMRQALDEVLVLIF